MMVIDSFHQRFFDHSEGWQVNVVAKEYELRMLVRKQSKVMVINSSRRCFFFHQWESWESLAAGA